MANEGGLSLLAQVYLNTQPAEAQWSAFERKRGAFKPVLDRSRFPAGALASDVSKLDKSLISATNRVTSLGAAFTVFFGIQRSFASFIKSTIDVEAALSRINVNLGESGSGLKEFSKGLFDTARLTGTSFAEAAKAAEEFSRQGLSVAEVQKRTRDALVLSRIAAIDATEATTDLTAAVNTFQKEGLTTTDIVNRLAAVDTRFAVSSRDLGLAISRVGNSAQEAGVTFNQLLGIVTAVQQTTQRGGAQIGNALKTIFTRISRPEVLEQLQQLGVATRDLNNNNLPAIQILKNLSATYDTLSQAQKSVLSEQVGGVYQINILKAAVKDLADANGTYVGALNAASNAQDEAFQKNEELNKSLQASISSTANSIKELFANIGNQRTSGLLKGVLDSFESARKALSGPQGGEGLGQTVGEGLVRGISNVLTGPVLVGATIAIFRGLKTIVTTFQSSLRAELGLKTVSEQRAAIYERINQIVAQATSQEKDQLSSATTLIGKREALLAIEERITAEKVRQVAAQAALADTFIAPGLGGQINSRLNVGGKRAAEGYLPALSGAAHAAGGIVPAVVQEQAAIAKGVGGVSPAARAVVIPNFVFGPGKRGALVANSEEHIVPDYNGSGGSAIFNPKMVREMGMPEGARRVTGAAEGHIPTAALGLGLRSSISSSIPAITSSVPSRGSIGPSFSRASVGGSGLSLRAAGGYIPNLAKVDVYHGVKKDGYDLSNGTSLLGLSRSVKGKDTSGTSFTNAEDLYDTNSRGLFATTIRSVAEKYAGPDGTIFRASIDPEQYLDLNPQSKVGVGVNQFYSKTRREYASELKASGKAGVSYFDNENAQGSGFKPLAKYPNAELGQTFVLSKGLKNLKFERAAGGYMPMAKDGEIPHFASGGPLGVRRGAVQVGEGTFGRYLHAPDSPFGFKAFKGDPDQDNLIRSEYAISKLSEELGLPVAKVYGSAKRGVERGGLYKEHIEGTLGKDIRPDYREAAMAVLGAKFQDKGIAAIDLSANNFMVRKGAKLDDLMSVVKNSVVIDPGFFENMNGDTAGKYNKHYYSKAGGYIPNLAKALSREAAAGVNPSSIYIDRDPRVRSSGNPEGLLVANRRDEPHGGYQGVNRVIAQGGNPQVAGALKGAAGGYIPSFVDFQPGDLSRSGFVSASRGNLAQVTTQEVTSLNELFKSLSKAASSKDAFAIGEQIHAFADTLDKASKGGVIKKLSFEFNELTLKAQKAAAAEQAASQVRVRDFGRAEKELGVGAKVPAVPVGPSTADTDAERAKSIERGFQLLDKDKTLSKAKKGLTDAEIRQSESVLGATQKLYSEARARGTATPIERPKSVLPPTYFANQSIAKYGSVLQYGPKAPPAQLAALSRSDQARSAPIFGNGQSAPSTNGGFAAYEARRNARDAALGDSVIALDAKAPPPNLALPKNQKAGFGTRAGRFLRSPAVGIGISLGAPILAGLVDSAATSLPGKGVGGTRGGIAAGAVSGALQGAGIGAIFGPIGIGVGAAGGALVGAITKLSKSVAEVSEEFEKQLDKEHKQLDAVDEFVQLQNQFNDAISAGDVEAAKRASTSRSRFLSNPNLDATVRKDLSSTGFDPKALAELRKTRAETLNQDSAKANASIATNTIASSFFAPSNEALKDAANKLAGLAVSKRADALRGGVPETASARVALDKTDFSKVDLSQFFVKTQQARRGAEGAPVRTELNASLKNVASLQAIFDGLGEKVTVTSANFGRLVEELAQSKSAYIEQIGDINRSSKTFKDLDIAALNVIQSLRRAGVSDFRQQTALQGRVERRETESNANLSVLENLGTPTQNLQLRGRAEQERALDANSSRESEASVNLKEILRDLISKSPVGINLSDSAEVSASKIQNRQAALSGGADVGQLTQIAQQLLPGNGEVKKALDAYADALEKSGIVLEKDRAVIEAKIKAEIAATEAIRRQTAFSSYSKEQGAQVGASLRGFGDKRGVSEGFLGKQDKAFLGLFDTLKSLGGNTDALKGQENKVRSRDNERSFLDLAKNTLSGINIPGFRNSTYTTRTGEADPVRIGQAAQRLTQSKDEGQKAIGQVILDGIKDAKLNRGDNPPSGRPVLTKDTNVGIEGYGADNRAAKTRFLLDPEKDRKNREAANRFLLNPQKTESDREAARKFVDQGGTRAPQSPVAKAEGSSDADRIKATLAQQAQSLEQSDAIANKQLEAARILRESSNVFASKQTEFALNLSSKIDVSVAGLDQYQTSENAQLFQTRIQETINSVMAEIAKLKGAPNPPSARRP